MTPETMGRVSLEVRHPNGDVEIVAEAPFDGAHVAMTDSALESVLEGFLLALQLRRTSVTLNRRIDSRLEQ